MTFGFREWLWALALLPLFGALFAWNEKRSRALLAKMIALRLQQGLAGSVSRPRRLIRHALFLLALACVIVALAEPRLGFREEKTPTRGRDVMIAIDTSKSMLSSDLPPNRLMRARLAAEDLVRLLPGDRAGLIAFAGNAFLEAPLTIDYGAVLDSVHELDTDTVPLGGTNIAEAIREAGEAFGKGESQNDCLILFTDGEELDGNALEAAKDAAGKFRIFTVGIGSAEGAVIPVPSDNGGTDFVKDENGQIVHSRLDETRLRQIAESTGGFYTHLQNGPEDMKRIVEDGLGKLKSHAGEEAVSRKPIERYQWPAGAGLLFLCAFMLISERKRIPAPKPRPKTTPARHVAAAALACLLLVPHAARAANHGIELYQQKNFKGALQDFQQQGQQNPDSDALQFDQGTASYQLGDYENAISAFGKALTSRDPALHEKSEYNLANSLFERAVPQERPKENRIADLRNAIQHYGEAIKTDPKDGNAVFNKEVAEKMLKQLQEKQPPPDQQNQKQNQKQDQKQNQDQKNQDQKDQKQQQGKSGSGKDQNQPQKPQDQNGGDQKSGDQKDQQKSAQDQKDGQQGQQGKQDQAKNGGDQKQDQKDGAGNQANQQPTPSQDGTQPQPQDQAKNGNDQQHPGSTGQNQNPNATPAPTPNKKLAGDIRAQAGASPSPGEQEGAEAAAAASPAKPGDMTSAQAMNLLESLKGEDARYPMNEQKQPPAVLKDW